MKLLRHSIRLVITIVVVMCGRGVVVWLVQSKPVPEAHTLRTRVPVVSVQTIVPRTTVIPVVG